MAYTTIKKPSDYFNTKLYTGTGSTQSITGVGFQPDLVWTKTRSNLESHELYDAVRGATKMISSNLTSAETTKSTALTGFDLDGFTLGSNGEVNASGRTFASWNWLGANGTAANTDGSISSTVSANTTSGFSIVSYTGTGANATVGHGLGVTPKMIIARSRSNGGAGWNWGVYHKDLGNTNAMFLNSTAASTSVSAYWNNTSPTSSVFSLGSDGVVNLSSGTFIAYCFAEKQGFSKFGSYVGNGSTDGTFVYTGFKPAFVITKASSASGQGWHMQDNKRDGFNYDNKRLFANSSDSESGTTRMDLLSNGFKYRDGDGNGNGITYIYMAFAEQPLVGDNPATAR